MTDTIWHEAWSSGSTPWANSNSAKHFVELYDLAAERYSIAPESAVFVPLCGDSPAVKFLHDRGHSVSALDLVPAAIEKLASSCFPNAEPSADGFHSERLELLQGDVFDYRPGERFRLVYDRAAFVALPCERRTAYARVLLEALEPGGIIVLEASLFDDSKLCPPPHSVDLPDIQQAFKLPAEVLFDREVHKIESRFTDLGIHSMQKRIVVLRKPGP